MKFYLFARGAVGSIAELPAVKLGVRAALASLSRLIEADAKARADG